LQRNEVHKDDFLRVIRNIVGDQMLKQAAHKVFAQVNFVMLTTSLPFFPLLPNYSSNLTSVEPV
jgi:hypothetical protein